MLVVGPPFSLLLEAISESFSMVVRTYVVVTFPLSLRPVSLPSHSNSYPFSQYHPQDGRANRTNRITALETEVATLKGLLKILWTTQGPDGGFRFF